MFSMSVVALLAALLLAPCPALGQAPETCTVADNRTHYCQDCITGVRCEALGPPVHYVTCDKAGEACALIGNISACVPLAISPCSCDKSQQCDAYDHSALTVCLDGDSSTIIISQCPDDEICISDICSEHPCEGVTEDGFVLIKPQCTAAVYCLDGAVAGSVYCAPGDYFDPDTANCVTSPPVPCGGGCTGACPDKTNCTRYYACEGRRGYLQECDDVGIPYFDPVSETCQADEDLCTPTHDCVFDITTTVAIEAVTTVPYKCTEDNVNHRYPCKSNCKMYWLCALVSPGQYEWMLMTCPGDYVYNPDTTYCDYPENASYCFVPTTSAP